MPPTDTDLPLEYEEEQIDYGLGEQDSGNMILDDLSLMNYDDIRKQLNRSDVTKSRATKLLKKVLEEAIHKRNQKALKQVFHAYINRNEAVILFSQRSRNQYTIRFYYKFLKTNSIRQQQTIQHRCEQSNQYELYLV